MLWLIHNKIVLVERAITVTYPIISSNPCELDALFGIVLPNHSLTTADTKSIKGKEPHGPRISQMAKTESLKI